MVSWKMADKTQGIRERDIGVIFDMLYVTCHYVIC